MIKSQEHLDQQIRIKQILNRHGFESQVEKRFIAFSSYHNKRVEYKADVFGTKNTRRLIIEVDGKTHNSKFQSKRDTRRTEDILRDYPEGIEVYRFTLAELQVADDTDIIEDLKL